MCARFPLSPHSLLTHSLTHSLYNSVPVGEQKKEERSSSMVAVTGFETLADGRVRSFGQVTALLPPAAAERHRRRRRRTPQLVVVVVVSSVGGHGRRRSRSSSSSLSLFLPFPFLLPADLRLAHERPAKGTTGACAPHTHTHTHGCLSSSSSSFFLHAYFTSGPWRAAVLFFSCSLTHSVSAFVLNRVPILLGFFFAMRVRINIVGSLKSLVLEREREIEKMFTSSSEEFGCYYYYKQKRN